MSEISEFMKCPQCGQPHLDLTEVPLIAYTCDRCNDKNDRTNLLADRKKLVDRSLAQLAKVSRSIQKSDGPAAEKILVKFRELFAIESQKKNPRPFYTFIGPPKSGKTQCGLEILKEAAQEGRSVSILWADQLLSMPQDRNCELIRNVDVLMVDAVFDFGAFHPQIKENLYTLLHFRRKLTIVNSRFDGLEFLKKARVSKYFGPIDEANFDTIRFDLAENGQVIRWNETTTEWELQQGSDRA